MGLFGQSKESKELEEWKAKYEREKQRREASERLLEDKSREIFLYKEQVEAKNVELNHKNEELSAQEEEIRQNAEEMAAINEHLSNTLGQLKESQKVIVEQEKMAVLGQLVAGVAHEINTPVGIAVTAASHLQSATDNFVAEIKNPNSNKGGIITSYIKDADESSKIILKNLERASELIQSFKKVAVDQSSEEAIKFRLASFTEDVMTSMRPTLRKANIAHEINISDTIELFTYAGALSQVLINFITNAARYAFDPEIGGQIKIEAHPQPDKTVILTFSDNGKGIPAEILPKIFDPFFTTGRSIGGSGLGLNIVYNLITQKLHGTVRVESIIGQGTIFIILIPLTIAN